MHTMFTISNNDSALSIFNDLIPWNIKNNASAYNKFGTKMVERFVRNKTDRQQEREKTTYRDKNNVHWIDRRGSKWFWLELASENNILNIVIFYFSFFTLCISQLFKYNTFSSHHCHSFFPAPRNDICVFAIGCVRDSNLSIHIQR